MIRLLFVFAFILTWSTSTFGQFQVSENRRFITRDGKPFFWLGDTAWELFHRLSKEDATYYFKKRSEQGFTVIQAVVNHVGIRATAKLTDLSGYLIFAVALV